MNNPAFEQQHGYYLDDLDTGMFAVVAKTFTEADVLMFSAVSGDTNPLHLNEEFSEQTRFKQRIVHGMLTTSLWSTLVGTRLPGPGCAYMGQELNFLKPVHIGDTVTARMTVTTIMKEKQRILLDAEAHVLGELVATGQAKVWVPRRKTSDPVI
ncbi:MAG: MaoC family dehydratase [Endozoicomonas sp.]